MSKALLRSCLSRMYVPNESTAEWYYEKEVTSPLHVVNLYRRIFMNEVGCYKLDI